MKHLVVFFVAMSTLFVQAQVKYNDQDFSDISKMADKIANVNAKNLIKDGIKKVMIVEFFGEFVTAKEVDNGYTIAKSSAELGSDYYEMVANVLYEKVKKIFYDNGIEILDKDTLINNQDYIALGLKQEKKGRQYTGGVAKSSKTSEIEKRSVTGMGMYSETLQLMAISKINTLVPKIANDNNCQAALKVKFRIGMGKKFTPTLDYINLTMDSKIDSYNAGKGKVTYYFKNGAAGICSTTKGLFTDADVMSNEKGKIDMDKYNDALMKLADALCNSYSYLIKEQMQKK